LTAYPTEVVVEIMKVHLSPMQRLLLGLTCTIFYAWHKKIARSLNEPRINLWEWERLHKSHYRKATFLNQLRIEKKVTLGELLSDWVPPDLELWLKPNCGHFNWVDDGSFFPEGTKLVTVEKARVGKGKEQRFRCNTSISNWENIKKRSKESKIQNFQSKLPKDFVFDFTPSGSATYPV
jgi:hypothetical protein